MSAPHYTDGPVTVWHGDCIDVMRQMPDNSVDAVVTDPPYNLTAGKKGGRGEASVNLDSPYGRSRITTGAGGFMGKGWDDYDNYTREDGSPGSFQHWCEDWAREAYRLLKPGGHLLAFGGMRTQHRLVSGIEDAGFEIRDGISWIYAQGFPKSLNVTEALNRLVPDDARCVCGHRSTRTAPSSPAGYPSSHGSGDARPHPGSGSGLAPVPSRADAPGRTRDGQRADAPAAGPASTSPDAGTDHLAIEDWLPLTSPPSAGSRASGTAPSGMGTSTSDGPETVPRRTDDRTPRTPGSAPGSASSLAPHQNMSCCECGGVVIPAGLGTALKPATEIITVARKPLTGTVAANVLAYGTGALNIDGSRIAHDGSGVWGNTQNPDRHDSALGYMGGEVGRVSQRHDAGRWPANVVLDASQAAALDQQSGDRRSAGDYPSDATTAGLFGQRQQGQLYADAGGASRFFYTAKASTDERPVHWKPSCDCETVKPWSSTPRDTDASDEADEPSSSTSTSGSSTTALFPPDMTSITATATSSTTGSRTSNSSRNSSTSASTADANSATTSGGSPAASAVSSSPSTSSTGTSAPKAGRSTAAAAPATSERSWKGSVCAVCGAPYKAESHATVKPVDLMRWLVKLVTPPGGTVLEPFAGSGTTVEACVLEGFHCIAIEREADYLPLILQRIRKPHAVGLDLDGWDDTPAPKPSKGRWPSNVILSESQADVLDEQSGERPGFSGGGATSGAVRNEVYGDGWKRNPDPAYYGDSGGASRFFKTVPDPEPVAFDFGEWEA